MSQPFNVSEVIIIRFGNSREHHLNLIETETNTKEGTDTEQEILIFAMTFLSCLFPPLFYLWIVWPTSSTKKCAICCSVTLPTQYEDLMENGKCIKSVLIFNFSAISSRELMAVQWGRKGLTSCTEGGNKGDVFKRGKAGFGFFFSPISVYNTCHFKDLLAI